MGRLETRIAIVTGGLSGIGRQIAQLFGEEGATVIIVDSRTESRDDGLGGEALVGSLRHGGLFVRGDVTQEAEVERAYELALTQYGRVDVVVNNAGVALFKPVEEITVDEYEHVMSVNVRGTFLMCRRALALMKTQPERGVIVNVASNFAFVAAPEASLYCASKGAVVTMTKGLALEGAPYGIRVNALCPGAIATEFNRMHRARPGVAEDWRSKTPLDLRREQFLALPEEIAPSAVYLASEDSKYMTGANLVIDGGWNAQ